MADLNNFDIQLLRICNGEDVPEVTGWGSWMTSCIEFLHGHRLLDRKRTADGIAYVTNDAGRAALRSQGEGEKS